MNFSIQGLFSKCKCSSVKFTEEILNKKHHFMRCTWFFTLLQVIIIIRSEDLCCFCL